MNSYVTHNFPPNVIGFINALSVKLSANATVNRVGSAFANIGILLTAERAGPLELSSIFTNTGCTFFLIASMFAKGWQIVLDGWIPYAATHVDAAKVMEKTSWNLSRETREREGRAHKNPRVSSQTSNTTVERALSFRETENERENKKDKEEEEEEEEEDNNKTHANAKGMSLAVNPRSKKCCLILPMMMTKETTFDCCAPPPPPPSRRKKKMGHSSRKRGAFQRKGRRPLFSLL